MLRYSFCLIDAANAVDNAINQTIADGYRTYDILKNFPQEKEVGTKEMGDTIVERLKRK